jgi:hypothetical protein
LVFCSVGGISIRPEVFDGAAMQVQTDADHLYAQPEFIGPMVPDASAKVERAYPQRSPNRLQLAVGFWLVGFAAGFVLWQYVGFWGLIQSVFYPGTADRPGHQREARATEPQSAAVAQSNGAPQSIGLLSVKLSPANCTSLILDRTQGEMVAAPCGSELMPLNSLRVARKEDRRISVTEAKAAAGAAATAPIAVTSVARPKSAPVVASAPAVASWSAAIVSGPGR